MNYTETIKNYISQGEYIMNKYKKIWKPEYTEVLQELKSIADNASNDDSYAYHMFNLTEISKYDDFGQYIQSQDASTCNLKFQTRIRQTKAKKICHQCGESEFIVVDGVQVCKKCKAELKTVGCSQLIAKENTDNSKHIMKQLKILTNEVAPPISISSMIKYLKIWFYDRSYLKSWLEYTNTRQQWNDKYKLATMVEVPDDFFITNDTHKLLPYNVFKLFTDEFYNLTSLVSKYRKFNSNMLEISIEEQIKVCNEYWNRYSKVPESEDVIVINDIEYQIGHYILHMLIEDVHSTSTLKRSLNSIFKTTIVLPGLMFNQEELDKVIAKKFTYQQNYMYIIHEVFDIPYFNIVESDKQQICKLMVSFNNYFKELKRNRMGKNCNSCLWQISLKNVLRLPYFRCYSEIIDILPDKFSNTSLMTSELWNQFQISHLEYLDKYRNILRLEKPNEIVNVTTKVVDDELDTTKIMDFINGTGECFDVDDNDKYLKEKIHLKESDHSWTNEFALGDDYSLVNKTLKDNSLIDSNEDSNEDSIGDCNEDSIKDYYNKRNQDTDNYDVLMFSNDSDDSYSSD